MLPDVEMSYAQNHVRDISYYDYYQYGLKNIGSGESFNHLVSNGISNLKAVSHHSSTQHAQQQCKCF
jgi:hypothetical protein